MDGYKKFIAELVRGGLPEPSASELSGLLHWLAGRSNEAAKAIQRAFNAHGIPGDIARQHTLAYLDQTLFRDRYDYYRLFGLTPDCSSNQIRRRHKQLLQIFHPDRHAEDGAWFTEKAEEINLAYAYLRANHGSAGTSSARVDRKPTRPPHKPPTVSAPRPGLWRSVAAKKGRVRQVLKAYIGSPRLFERRLYIVLYSVPMLLVLLVYMNHIASPFEGSDLIAGKEDDSEPFPPAATTQAPIQVDSPKKVVASTMGGAGADETPRSTESLPIEEPVSSSGSEEGPSNAQLPERRSKQVNTAAVGRTVDWRCFSLWSTESQKFGTSNTSRNETKKKSYWRSARP